MDKRILLAGLIGFLLFISACSQSNDLWTIDGNSVYVDDDNVYISIEPHTISHSGWVEATFESKVYSGDIDVVFGFPTESIKPKYVQLYSPHEIDQEYSYVCEHEFNYTTNPNFFTCYNEENSTLIFEHSFLHGDIPSQTAYWNETYDIEWRDFSAGWNSIDLEYNDKNKWWYIQGQHINADQEYKIRYYLEKTPSSYGKYDMAIKPSSETIQEAIANGHLYILDPWYLGTTDYDVDLWAYYNFDAYDGDFMRDNASAGNNIDLSQEGTVALQAGYLNNAAYFEGYTGGTGEYLNISGLGQISFDELTVCSWWEVENEASPDSERGIMADGTGSSSGMEIQHPGSGDVDKRGNALWGLTTTGGGVTVWGNATGTKLYPPSGVSPYHFVCFVYDGTEARIYVNGTLASEVAGNYPITGNIIMDRLEFGKDIGLPTGDDHEFSGEMDETGIWNRSFTQAEINVLYDNYVAGYGYIGGGTDYVKELQFIPSTFYYNNTVNCSFVGAIGTTFNATINWTNSSKLVESNIYENQPNGTVISDLYDFTTGEGFVAGNEIDCIVSIYNLTDIGITGIESSVSSYAPTVPTILSPANDTSSFTNPILTCSGSTDPEGDTINYNISVNGTNMGLSPYSFPGANEHFNWSCRACVDTTCSAYTETRDFNLLGIGMCNDTYDIPLIGFSYLDEEDLTAKNGSINLELDITPSDGNEYTFTHVNTSYNTTWDVCIVPNVTSTFDIAMIYEGDGYYTRNYENSYTFNGTGINQPLYLLDTTIGNLEQFIVTSIAGSPLQGVDVTVDRKIGGATTYTQIMSGQTDDSGSVSFFLIPNFQHRLTFTKTGYLSYITTITPSGSGQPYIITLGGATGQENQYDSYLDGISYSISPSPGPVTYGTTYNFIWIVDANLSNINTCYLNLSNSSGYIDGTSGCNANGGTIYVEHNATDLLIIGEIYLDLNQSNVSTGITKVAQYSWTTLSENATPVSTIENVLGLISNYTGFGTNTNERDISNIIFWFFAITILIGIFTFTTNVELRNEGTALFLLFGLLALLSLSGAMTINNLPLLAGTRQWGITLLAFLVWAGWTLHHLAQRGGG